MTDEEIKAWEELVDLCDGKHNRKILWSHERNAILAKDAECRALKERVEAMEKAIQWAHAPFNVFAFDPNAREMFLAELDRVAALKEAPRGPDNG